MFDAVVAGHICLDIIPELSGHVAFEPGRLVEAGPATLSTGGAVSNTGLALTKLGLKTRLIGKVGRGPFGRTICEILDSHQPGLGASMSVVEGEGTSYTIVVSLSGHDRMFLHSPGCNSTFTSDDVPDEALANTRHFHFGYPPLMAGMFANDGEELVRLFRRAKEHGASTSLDMSLPDADAPSGRADWETILKRVLPYVDVFVPSIEELLFMLERQTFEQLRGVVWSGLPSGAFERLATRALQMGAKVVGIKAGSRGLFLRTSKNVEGLDLGPEWRDRSVWAPCYCVEVVGTTGAGDATIGGFLKGLLSGMSPEDSLNAGVASGACCCEQPDAVSGIRSWEETETRIESGWPRIPLVLGREWRLTPKGVYERDEAK
ncbi:carbohydrate kinase family protein [Fimbriimonas ginsengisoli]|uniref:PfkB domain protein n=1 Tax=Fimbriimonas ginsengisoli Gsoil 348 TaxID=661478 RepID=A0A068NSJ9_FIMGI|nr:carbohydrate kinase family protein [Fimbriimonas ginsengisoli]AIE86421.1 PfkB domain protein [Fimbriimonas ginsengisoli Gsoil 348]